MQPVKIDNIVYSAIPLSPDDLIQCEAVSNTVPVAIIIEGTALNIHNAIVPFQFLLSTTVTVTLVTELFRLGYTSLLSIVAHTRTASIPDGDCFCRLTLVKSETGGVNPHRKLLTEGYISTFSSIGYGSSAILGPPTDHKHTVNLVFPIGSTNRELLFTVPDFTLFELVAIRFTLLTDATAANRFLSLRVSSTPGVPLIIEFGTPVTASQEIRFGCANGIISYLDETNDIASFPIPTLRLYPGAEIRIMNIGFQTNDFYEDNSLFALRSTIPNST